MSGYRRDYTKQEDRIIIEYIIENKLYKFVKGDRIWKNLVRDTKIDRPWRSCHNRFRRKISLDIGNRALYPYVSEYEAQCIMKGALSTKSDKYKIIVTRPPLESCLAPRYRRIRDTIDLTDEDESLVIPTNNLEIVSTKSEIESVVLKMSPTVSSRNDNDDENIPFGDDYNYVSGDVPSWVTAEDVQGTEANVKSNKSNTGTNVIIASSPQEWYDRASRKITVDIDSEWENHRLRIEKENAAKMMSVKHVQGTEVNVELNKCNTGTNVVVASSPQEWHDRASQNTVDIDSEWENHRLRINKENAAKVTSVEDVQVTEVNVESNKSDTGANVVIANTPQEWHDHASQNITVDIDSERENHRLRINKENAAKMMSDTDVIDDANGQSSKTHVSPEFSSSTLEMPKKKETNLAEYSVASLCNTSDDYQKIDSDETVTSPSSSSCSVCLGCKERIAGAQKFPAINGINSSAYSLQNQNDPNESTDEDELKTSTDSESVKSISGRELRNDENCTVSLCFHFSSRVEYAHFRKFMRKYVRFHRHSPYRKCTFAID